MSGRGLGRARLAARCERSSARSPHVDSAPVAASTGHRNVFVLEYLGARLVDSPTIWWCWANTSRSESYGTLASSPTEAAHWKLLRGGGTILEWSRVPDAGCASTPIWDSSCRWKEGPTQPESSPRGQRYIVYVAGGGGGGVWEQHQERPRLDEAGDSLGCTLPLASGRIGRLSPSWCTCRRVPCSGGRRRTGPRMRESARGEFS